MKMAVRTGCNRESDAGWRRLGRASSINTHKNTGERGFRTGDCGICARRRGSAGRGGDHSEHSCDESDVSGSKIVGGGVMKSTTPPYVDKLKTDLSYNLYRSPGAFSLISVQLVLPFLM